MGWSNCCACTTEYGSRELGGRYHRPSGWLRRPRLMPSPGISNLIDAVAFRHSYGEPETRLGARSDTRRSVLPKKRARKGTIFDVARHWNLAELSERR
jgi:hypothetical protein